MADNKTKISKQTFALMVGVALFIDLLEAALLLVVIGSVLNSLINLIVYPSFWFWFKLKGVNFLTPKRALIGAASLVIELFPVINILPGLTAAVVLTYLTVKAEEKLHLTKTEASQSIKPLAGRQKTAGKTKQEWLASRAAARRERLNQRQQQSSPNNWQSQQKRSLGPLVGDNIRQVGVIKPPETTGSSGSKPPEAA